MTYFYKADSASTFKDSNEALEGFSVLTSLTVYSGRGEQTGIKVKQNTT